MTAFFSLDVKPDGSRNGVLVEYDATEKIFTQLSDERTEGYVTGRLDSRWECGSPSPRSFRSSRHRSRRKATSFSARWLVAERAGTR